jgi:hypothetical protein
MLCRSLSNNYNFNPTLKQQNVGKVKGSDYFPNALYSSDQEDMQMLVVGGEVVVKEN